ncbi:MAG: radical SAM protein [Calditrichaceae bacterium]|nr:radical SAM protein [Calditrichaceae bacterium]RQV96671.1 MAG: radical SAM protein [Calditrichota bacterium]
MNLFEPGYLKLYKSGELKRRVDALNEMLASCRVCPRMCGVNRFETKNGICRIGHLPSVVSICDHHGEEPALSGSNGSGTVFFGGCNLRCVYCQNHEISQEASYFSAFEMETGRLAEKIVDLQNIYKVHNINFVSPSHCVPQMAEAILKAVPLGLEIPIVYNSNGYDSVEVLKLLEGIIDIYLPDLKYANDQTARQYSGGDNYRETARAAIKEMYRQVGNLQTDKKGIARHGLIVRHLILPNDLSDTRENLAWIANELSPQVTVSLMAQYYPANRAMEFPLISRTINYSEYLSALNALEELDMTAGFIQQMDAPEYYQPHFRENGHPFE